MSSPSTEPENVPEPGERWSEEHPDTEYHREDERWNFRSQLRDWMVLLLIIVTYIVWAGLIYLLEPGIR
jgi:hypothetical protein